MMTEMADVTRDLTGCWTPGLAADTLLAAVKRARADRFSSGNTTLLTSDGEDVAVVMPIAEAAQRVLDFLLLVYEKEHDKLSTAELEAIRTVREMLHRYVD